MIWISSILLVALFVAVLYIIGIKRNIKKIEVDVKEREKIETNTLITTNFQMKEMDALIKQFNKTLQVYQKQEILVEKKNQQLQKTIINISHDLRTPLTSAMGYLELLQGYSMDISKKEEYAKIIVTKLEDLSKLIEDFFVFTKVVTNAEEIVWEEVDINRIFEETVASYYQNFKMQGRQFQITGSKKIMRLTNERMLRHVFDNIIVNALAHSQSDVHVAITIEEAIQYTFTNIVDERIDVEAIFEEFYTADISRTKQSTGLGLAIVKAFVEQLGGNVFAKQEGNQFQIILVWPKG